MPRRINNRIYKRKGRKYSIEEIIPLIEKRSYKEGTGSAKRIDIDGDIINIRSKRLYTFVVSGTRCCCCGLAGQYFVKEQHRLNQIEQKKYYHLNLYGVDKNGNEKMLTSDHIISRSSGGSNSWYNRQTLCSRCNRIKGARRISNDNLLQEIRG